MRIPLGAQAEFFIPVRTADGSTIDVPITGPGVLRCREAIHAMRNHDNLSRSESRVVAGIRANCRMVAMNPDSEIFSNEMIAAAFMVCMIDGFGEITLDAPPEGFARMARAETIRALIADLDPNHPDGLGHSSEFNAIIDDLGVELGVNGVGSHVRAAGDMTMDEVGVRRMVMANDRLMREVFGAMTRTAIGDLSVAIINRDDRDAKSTTMASC